MRTVTRLDTVATDAALNAAIEHRAPVILESVEFNGSTVNGLLVSGDAQALLMEVTGRPAVDLQKLLNVACNGQIYGERRFTFSSRITSTPFWGDTRAVAFVRPHELVVLERRRFFRAKLAPSSTVELHWKGPGGARSHHAALLNISADGLACRLEEAVAAEIDTHMRLAVNLTLEGEEIRDLKALVSNKTPGSEGCALLGLHFLRDARDAQKISALRAALSSESRGEPERINE